MKINRLLIGIMTIILGLVGSQATVQAKTHYLKVTQRSYLQTQRQMTIKNAYYKNIKITLPKGTVVQVAGVSKSKRTHHPFITIDMDSMSYHLRKPFYQSKRKPNMTAGIWATTANFKKIASPIYLRYYYVADPDTRSAGSYLADGNLWRGVRWPTDEVKAKGTGFKVTVDGYLESYSKVPVFQAYAPKPQGYAKIRKTVDNGKTTDFYVKNKIKGAPLTRVAKTGNDQYRLSITRTGEHSLTMIPEDDHPQYVDSVEVSERYLIAGKDYYMHTEVLF
ncbi:hypothetical protein [Lentilactobacillus parafarraginis]|uniref:Uncharacterized protein n=2 Tax=Lentilactobacillus parafarraginis TaxID=390842 RepID=A0A0R1Z132_9LACO|nr:hypothetical protein [Lentilactobacillus parafarraginis]KRM45526.1 hypothetical protein FD47_GL001357 [Lentilactobacillus parafarraginis DSM 18390 = JCM 14109]